MDQHNRDMGTNYIKTRKKHPCYGMGLGIIVLDDPYPGFPGDVRNASAFPYPIQYKLPKVSTITPWFGKRIKARVSSR